LLGGEELAGLFEEHAQLVVTVRAEKVEEVLFEDLLASHPPGDLESAVGVAQTGRSIRAD
jgi:hypothetical protein